MGANDDAKLDLHTHSLLLYLAPWPRITPLSTPAVAAQVRPALGLAISAVFTRLVGCGCSVLIAVYALPCPNALLVRHVAFLRRAFDLLSVYFSNVTLNTKRAPDARSGWEVWSPAVACSWAKMGAGLSSDRRSSGSGGSSSSSSNRAPPIAVASRAPQIRCYHCQGVFPLAVPGPQVPPARTLLFLRPPIRALPSA